MFGDLDEPGWDAVRLIVTRIGPSTIPALLTAAVAENETLASKRVSGTIISFGKAAVSRLAPLISDDRWYAQLTGANILGAIASPEAVPSRSTPVRPSLIGPARVPAVRHSQRLLPEEALPGGHRP